MLSEAKACASALHRRSPVRLLAVALFVALLLWAIDALSVSITTTIYSSSSVFVSVSSATEALSLPAQPTTAAAAVASRSLQFLSWISAPSTPNFTRTLISRWQAPGGEPCRDSRTTDISVPGLDHRHVVELAAGETHEFSISALGDGGSSRCVGGDYFETDLSGSSWKSRPPVVDHGNGSYSFQLQVHPDFPGEYNLTIVLLFRSFEGLKLSPLRFKYNRQMRKFQIRFRRSSVLLQPLHLCRSGDFSRPVWSGRWTRHAENDSCGVDGEGRYRCLDPSLLCPEPWCEGPLAALESNGWVYSAHCRFRVFTQESAWRCLRNKWLFFWGDSNHVDTIRNLLNFVLGRTDIDSVPRRFDANFTNPAKGSESVRITNVFNGHWNESMNYLGLQSLRNQGFRDLVLEFFQGPTAPDVMLFNSGLHDGIYWRSVRAFAQGAEYAAEFWEQVMGHVARRTANAPRIFYRTTIAAGGYARELAFNPSKMEAFDGVLLEKLKGRGLITGGVIDEFDMSFPWHFDNRCNDGVHYGRKPAKARWRDGEVGHYYFVDLMLVHVLLNAICHV
ncbi:uncharacterized protein LOC122005169 [Zingiber officinale]|uniref:Uncharacterized protein n=1 Tax=Zingiber officinale TaxID=94328 RepID=A0A8J5FJL1_ZINOF|nr:uncharacterized protein LOC122005169 [Zingiber officinale]KAG6488743.1 hypothetical protein ZIOFF_049992 [Zingiber officinale]